MSFRQSFDWWGKLAVLISGLRTTVCSEGSLPFVCQPVSLARHCFILACQSACLWQLHWISHILASAHALIMDFENREGVHLLDTSRCRMASQLITHPTHPRILVQATSSDDGINAAASTSVVSTYVEGGAVNTYPHEPVSLLCSNFMCESVGFHSSRWDKCLHSCHLPLLSSQNLSVSAPVVAARDFPHPGSCMCSQIARLSTCSKKRQHTPRDRQVN